MTLGTEGTAGYPRRLQRLVYLRDLLRALVIRDLTIRYKRSLLGVGWSLLVPLSQLLILSFIFQVVLPLNVPHYATYLYSGLLPWSWFNTSLMAATTSVPSNRELVRQVGFPVWILPIITVSSQFLHFLMAVPFLFVFLWIDQRPVTTAAAALPLVMALQGLFILALAYFVSAFQVFFHDTRHLLGITLTLMFYMTPVFYHLDAVPPGYTLLFELNPMVHLLTAYRAILIGGELPAVAPLAAVGAGSTVLVIVGRRLFIRLRYRFVQEL